MNRAFLLWFYAFLLIACGTLSGCSLLQIPAALIEGSFGLVSSLIKLVAAMPKPPPWVFF